MNATERKIQDQINQLGELDQKIRELKVAQEALKDQLKASGIEQAETDRFSFKRSDVETTRTDWKSVAHLYEIPKSVIKKHTTVSASVRITVREVK